VDRRSRQLGYNTTPPSDCQPPIFNFFIFLFQRLFKMVSALFLEGGAALTTGNPDLPLSSGDPELDATGGALKNLELTLLLGFGPPALFGIAETAGLLEELTILLLPLGNVSGQGAIDTDARSQNKNIIQDGVESPHRNEHGGHPADKAKAQDGCIQLVNSVSSHKHAFQHHSHVLRLFT